MANMAARQVLNYHDVQLYASDVALFSAPCWLNDNALNFYLQFSHRSLGAADDAALFVDPAVVSCLLWQCEDDEELRDLARGLELRDKRLCFVPVNDSESLGGSSSHWSLLVVDRDTDRLQHFDSSAGHNRGAARRVARAFEKLLRVAGDGREREREVVEVPDAPQQTNGYDCGMYVLLVAEYLYRAHLGLPVPAALGDYVTPERVASVRKEVPAIVQRLLQQQGLQR